MEEITPVHLKFVVQIGINNFKFILGESEISLRITTPHSPRKRFL